MIVAGAVKRVDRSFVIPVPSLVADGAIRVHPLDVGLSFTPTAFSEAGSILPRSIAVIR